MRTQTEIDLEAEQIYARVVGQVVGLALRLGWINNILARIIKSTSHCPA
jgi:hypothetical protein